MSFSYNQNIPDGPNNPSADQPLMKINTNSIFNIIAVDHIGFNSTPGGYHNIIHFNDQGATTPPQVLGVGQLFTKTVGSDQELFYESGNAVVTQLTGASPPSPGTNGYVYLSGGILLQWGIVNGTHGSDNHFSGGDTGTVTFSTSNIAFPNNCFGVTANALDDLSIGSKPTSNNNIVIDRSTLSKTKFDWLFVTNSSQYFRFFWMAIGN